MSRHFVSDRPFDPARAMPALSHVSPAWLNASQARLFWWRFRRHRLAVISLGVLGFLYLVAAFGEFIAPVSSLTRDTRHIFIPPQAVHLFHGGRFVGPFVYPARATLDMATLQRRYTVDPARPMRLRFLCRGEPYRFWGLIPAERHLFCAPAGGTAFLLGSDRLGRDIFSRLVHGARVSLTIGLVGVGLSLLLGLKSAAPPR